MENTVGPGGSQEAAARDLEEVPRLIAEAAAGQNDEDLRDAPRHAARLEMPALEPREQLAGGEGPLGLEAVVAIFPQ